MYHWMLFFTVSFADFLIFFNHSADVGASDAADWAIARSLKSLKNAEEQGDGGSAGGSHQGSHQSAADDDESV